MLNYITLSVAAALSLLEPQADTKMPESSLGGLRIGGVESDIIGSTFVYKKRQLILEGEEYVQYLINIGNGVEVYALLTGDQKIFELGTQSLSYKDPNNIGIGTELGTLMKVYPEGKLVRGYAEGYILNYVIKSKKHLSIFAVDKSNIPKECLERISHCNLDFKREKVVKFFIR